MNTLGGDSHGKHTFQYIPLIDVLNLILTSSASQEHIFDCPQKESDALTNFSDGLFFKNLHFLAVSPVVESALQGHCCKDKRGELCSAYI